MSASLGVTLLISNPYGTPHALQRLGGATECPGVSNPDGVAGCCFPLHTSLQLVQHLQACGHARHPGQGPILRVRLYLGLIEEHNSSLVKEIRHYTKGRDPEGGLVGDVLVEAKLSPQVHSKDHDVILSRRVTEPKNTLL